MVGLHLHIVDVVTKIYNFPAVNTIVAYGALTWECPVEFLIQDQRYTKIIVVQLYVLQYVA